MTISVNDLRSEPNKPSMEAIVRYLQQLNIDTSALPKGWVNFDGTGTIAIRDSFNVTSLTDHATGNYSVNWTTNFAATNYAVVLGALGDGGNVDHIGIVSLTAGAARVELEGAASYADTDASIVCVIATGTQ